MPNLMNCKFYLLLISILYIFTPTNGLSQATLKWEKAIHVSQSGASNAMVTDANLNSYIITVKEDSSFFYKFDSTGSRVLKVAFPQKFESTTQAQLVNQSQIVFFGNTNLQTLCYRLDLNGNFLKTTILPAKEYILNFDCDANSNVYYVAEGINVFSIGKINFSGTLDWRKNFNDSNTENELNPIIKCGSHNDLLLIYDGVNATNQSLVNPVVSLNTNNGNIQWKSFIHNRLLSESTILPAAFTIDNSGDIIAYATVYDTISGNANSWLVKFNYANGATISRVMDSSSAILDHAYSLQIMADNKVMVIGANLNSFGNIIRCLNLNGVVNWTRNIGSRFLTIGNNSVYAATESNRILFAQAPIFGITDTVKIISLNTQNQLQQILEYRHQSTKQPLFQFTPILIGDIHLNNGSLVLLGNAAETVNSFSFEPSETFLLRFATPALTGIALGEKEMNEWILYPNPVKDKLVLKNTTITDNCQYSVYNALGKLIEEGNILNSNCLINTSTYASGVYTIRIGATTHKFIK